LSNYGNKKGDKSGGNNNNNNSNHKVANLKPDKNFTNKTSENITVS
jgi:hypothetical protein